MQQIRTKFHSMGSVQSCCPRHARIDSGEFIQCKTLTDCLIASLLNAPCRTTSGTYTWCFT